MTTDGVPLIRDENGYIEPVIWPPNVEPDAYRKTCTDPDCPSTWPGMEHSHIVEFVESASEEHQP